MVEQTQVDGTVGSEGGGSQSLGQEADIEQQFVDVRFWMPKAKIWASLPLAVPCVIPGFDDIQFVTSVDVGSLIFDEVVRYSVSERSTGFWVGRSEGNTREEAIVAATKFLHLAGYMRFVQVLELARQQMTALAASPAQAPALSSSERNEVTEGLSYELPVDNGPSEGTATQSDSTKEEV